MELILKNVKKKDFPVLKTLAKSLGFEIEEKIKALTIAKVFPKPIITEVMPVTDFYKAEDYHQDYVKLNPNQPYVRAVSIPRFNLFKKKFKGKLKN